MCSDLFHAKYISFFFLLLSNKCSTLLFDDTVCRTSRKGLPCIPTQMFSFFDRTTKRKMKENADSIDKFVGKSLMLTNDVFV